ncbi:hypothetical protein WL21_04700 [Burkholderia ubonensis]|uniref:type III secretion system cytoplasmic ring protein SctQ n=1 Tax=Burkholderia ubonensis TaxID=101571 RepID=UPI00075306DD|nr:type III secretion system cytoplasmic ring protein SctQ [Burkholderia ubonensis]KVO87686.1 hypothetical protein WJ81_15670 [Burkholderia ubonensis]KVZ57303.1 hypothetical protein WL20_23455 [Burkholderia ubonensis]KVZ73000.1 hypothetical protein WL21_04700 [Burkholderia ubonensis]
MKLSAIRKTTSAALNARRLLDRWTQRDVAWSRQPVAAGGTLAQVTAFGDAGRWSGYVDLHAWLAGVAPQVAALSRQADNSGGYALRLFNTHARPIEIPASMPELSYEQITASLPATWPAGDANDAIAVPVAHGSLWLTELPEAIGGELAGLTGWARTLPVALEFRLGATRVRRRLLRSLRRGDVLLIQDVRFSVFGAGRALTAFKIDEKGMISVSEERNDFQPAYAPVHDGGAGPIDLADLPVQVEFVLHRCAMSVAEVDAWAGGTFLSLGAEAGQHVEIVSGGATIAHGELVELDGRLGVEIRRTTRGGHDG